MRLAFVVPDLIVLFAPSLAAISRSKINKILIIIRVSVQYLYKGSKTHSNLQNCKSTYKNCKSNNKNCKQSVLAYTRELKFRYVDSSVDFKLTCGLQRRDNIIVKVDIESQNEFKCFNGIIRRNGEIQSPGISYGYRTTPDYLIFVERMNPSFTY